MCHLHEMLPSFPFSLAKLLNLGPTFSELEIIAGRRSQERFRIFTSGDYRTDPKDYPSLKVSEKQRNLKYILKIYFKS